MTLTTVGFACHTLNSLGVRHCPLCFSVLTSLDSKYNLHATHTFVAYALLLVLYYFTLGQTLDRSLPLRVFFCCQPVCVATASHRAIPSNDHSCMTWSQ